MLLVFNVDKCQYRISLIILIYILFSSHEKYFKYKIIIIRKFKGVNKMFKIKNKHRDNPEVLYFSAIPII